MEDHPDRQSTETPPHSRSSPEDLMDQWFESILRQNQEAMMRGPGYHRPHNPSNDNNFSSYSSSSSSSSYSLSYQMQENDKQIQISVNVPGMSKQDIDVQVISQTGPYSSCMVQLLSTNDSNKSEKRPVVTSSATAHRTMLGQRFRLGQNVDCDHLAATLSRGVLHLTAPKFQPVTRSIPINSERDDE
jgi:HSP20 family molecular chaperone IbpA